MYKKGYTADMHIYEQILIDHFRNPKNKGTIPSPDFSTQQYIPSCGDTVSMQGVVKDNVLIQVAFMGSGCVISQAAASLLTECALGKSLDVLLALDKNNMLSMLNMQLGPMRVKCAELALYALQEGLREYKKSGNNDHA